jgi:hydroxypyruvate isomerase
VITDFTLAVCAEMIFTELPITERIRRIDDLGFQVEIWDWTRHDIDGLRSTGATFSSMTGYVTGDLIDSDGADELLATAEQSIPVAAKLGIPRLNLHGTGLDSQGLPVKPVELITGDMWLKAEHTLARIAELGQRDGVIFCFENLNTAVDHPGTPFAKAADTLALVAAVNSPHLRLMLDIYHAQMPPITRAEVAQLFGTPRRSARHSRLSRRRQSRIPHHSVAPPLERRAGMRRTSGRRVSAPRCCCLV